jgi:iron complex outermembrane receptor protein
VRDGQLHVNNAFDRLYRISNSDSFAAQGFAAAIYGQPRMFGAQIRYRFGSFFKP